MWCHVSGDSHRLCWVLPGLFEQWEAATVRAFSYLCDGQLQLNHVLGFGHWRLKGCVQEQDAIQVLPASYCIVIHKKHLVHCRKVLTPDTAARFS